MNFEQTLHFYPQILMEAAVLERLRCRPDIQLHPRLENALLIYSSEGRNALTALYQEYIDIARCAKRPIVLSTPTWRANRERLAEASIETDVNADAVRFMKSFSGTFTGGLIGCRNDCYKPEKALAENEAYDFHRWQITRLTEADFLYAVTLPEIGEARGIARAMAETDLPYIISFVLGNKGRILDDTPLESAIEQIDAETVRPPIGYGVNCCYPTFLQASELSGHTAERMISIQANASSLTHAELEAAETVKADPVENWSRSMRELHRSTGIKALGGCCGTTGRHLKSLVQR